MRSVAKVFTNGRFQAVRLPKQFRIDCAEVYINKEGDRLILEPKPKISWAEFFQTEACPDFEIERDTALPQKRELF